MKRSALLLSVAVGILCLPSAALFSTGADSDPAVSFEFSPALSDSSVTVSIHTSDPAVQGWAVGICHDPERARIASYSMSDELAVVNLSGLPDFYVVEEASNETYGGIIQAIVLSHFTSTSLPAEPENGFPVLDIVYEVLGESEISVCDGLVGGGQPVATSLTVEGITVLPSHTATATLAQKPYAQNLAYKIEPPETSEVVTVVMYSEEVQVEGWSFALCHTSANADVVELATSPTLEQIVDGEPPDFVLNDILTADPFVAITQTVILGTAPDSVSLGPFPEGLPLMGIRYDVEDDDTLKFCDQIGDVTFSNHVTIDGIGYVPADRPNGHLVNGALGTSFVRGDADLDGRVRMTDAVFVLMALFRGSGPLPCRDAADANDVGGIDLSDAIYILRYLYMGGPAPLSPFPDPGEDLSPRTALGCERGL